MRGAGDQHTAVLVIHFFTSHAESFPLGNFRFKGRLGGWYSLNYRWLSFYHIIHAFWHYWHHQHLMESFGIFSPNHNMGGWHRGIHIKNVSCILAENTQWNTLKLQDPLYMHHSEGYAHSWLRQIQGSDYLRSVEMLRFKQLTERSDIGPYPPTHFHSGRKW